MKCEQCGGRLEALMTFCPYCGVRQDVDLRQIHFRDLGEDAALPCPCCTTALRVIEFAGEPPIHIEHCATCHGLFFNPGELEVLLDAQTNPLVWLDPAQLDQIAADFGQESRDRIVYRKCPVCAERMSHLNFGGHSGVILDRCGTHGVWLQGGELRRLTEWWRAGGKVIYQQNENERAAVLYAPRIDPARKPAGGSVDAEEPEPWSWNSPTHGNISLWAAVIGTILEALS